MYILGFCILHFMLYIACNQGMDGSQNDAAANAVDDNDDDDDDLIDVSDLMLC